MIARIRCAFVDPADEVVDYIGWEAVGALGHAFLRVGVANESDQETLTRVAGNEGGARLAAFLPATAVVEPKSAFGFVAGVTLVAMVYQRRANVRLEVGGICQVSCR